MVRNLNCVFTPVLAGILSLPLWAAAPTAQPKTGQPTNPKAQKTFGEALDWQKQHDSFAAVSAFRKANKQDGGHCSACVEDAYRLAMKIGDYKSAEGVMNDWLAQATDNTGRATAHFELGLALERQGIAEKKNRCFDQSCDEFKQAVALDPAIAFAHFGMGIALAHLHQDDEARAEFKAFLDQDHSDDPVIRARAQRYVDRIELARARMAPAFTLTTIDGRQISLDDLAGKVVLIDFWATWCGPCREALPHMRKVVERFKGEPFVAISVSLDSDDKKWREFVAKNEMTWLQYRDDGSIARKFGVTAIPATFSIDADGVLEDQNVGDAHIEGELKKLIAQAQQTQNRKLQAAGSPAVSIQ